MASQLQLSAEQVAGYRRAFTVFDKDGVGEIDTKDLGNVWRTLGEEASNGAIENVVHKFNLDRDDTLSFEKFLEIMSYQLAGGPDTDQPALMEAFRAFYRNGGGYISTTELTQIMGSLGEKLSDEEMNELVRDADRDGDGQVKYEGALKMILRR